MTLLLVSVTVRSEQKIPDFSGKWTLNREQSDFGHRQDGKKRTPRSSTMIIEQDEKNLKVTMIRTDRDGKEDKRKFKYSLEGKKTKNKTESGKQESTTRWIENGQSLEINSTMDVKRGDMEFTMETVQIFSIVEGRLVIESVRYTPRGEMETLAIYDLKSDKD
jgi:hypothetical protein